MKAESVIEVEFPDEDSARAAEKAVSHEGAVGSRAKSGVERRGRRITVRVAADDVVALRATVNAFLREFQVFEGIAKGNI